MDNKPTHFVYTITERQQDGNEEKRDFWTKIGAAWPHSDGKGFSLNLDALPMNDRLVLREPEEKEVKEDEDTVE